MVCRVSGVCRLHKVCKFEVDTGIVNTGTTKDRADMCINNRFNVILGSVGFRVYRVCNLFRWFPILGCLGFMFL